MGQAFYGSFVGQNIDVFFPAVLGVVVLALYGFVQYVKSLVKKLAVTPQQKPQVELAAAKEQPNLGPYRTPQVPTVQDHKSSSVVVLPPEICHPPQENGLRQALRAPANVTITVGEHDPSKCTVCKGSGLAAKIVIHTVVEETYVLKAGKGGNKSATYNGCGIGGEVRLLPRTKP